MFCSVLLICLPFTRCLFDSSRHPQNSTHPPPQGALISREEAAALRAKGEHYYVRSIDFVTAIDGIKEARRGDALGSLLNDGILPEFVNCKYIVRVMIAILCEVIRRAAPEIGRHCLLSDDVIVGSLNVSSVFLVLCLSYYNLFHSTRVRFNRYFQYFPLRFLPRPRHSACGTPTRVGTT